MQQWYDRLLKLVLGQYKCDKDVYVFYSTKNDWATVLSAL